MSNMLAEKVFSKEELEGMTSKELAIIYRNQIMANWGNDGDEYYNSSYANGTYYNGNYYDGNYYNGNYYNGVW